MFYNNPSKFDKAVFCLMGKLTVFIVDILPLFAEQWMAESPEFMLEQIGLAVLWKNPHLITYGLPLF